MARPKNPYPIPKLGRRGKSWRIRWFHEKKLYEITLGPKERAQATTLCAGVALALAGNGEWPVEIADEQAVKLYQQAKDGELLNAHLHDTAEGITEAYYQHMLAKSKSTWPVNARSHIKRFFEFFPDPASISLRMVANYLDAMTSFDDRRYNSQAEAEKATGKKGLSNATRNRARMALSGLFSWMRRTEQRPKSWDPLDGIALLREERPIDGILVWERDEEEALLAAADRVVGGIGVWVAVRAGLRRSEVMRLEWDDITDTYIIVRKSKTGRQRQVPLSLKLAERLKKEKQQGIRVVAWPESLNGWVRRSGSMLGTHLPEALAALHAEDPETYPKKIAELATKKPALFNWNPFRHTFASKLAQAGNSLDLIAGWIGDSPKVCRDHYARFVPKSVRDPRIDAVDLPDLNAPPSPASDTTATQGEATHAEEEGSD